MTQSGHRASVYSILLRQWHDNHRAELKFKAQNYLDGVLIPFQRIFHVKKNPVYFPADVTRPLAMPVSRQPPSLGLTWRVACAGDISSQRFQAWPVGHSLPPPRR